MQRTRDYWMAQKLTSLGYAALKQEPEEETRGEIGGKGRTLGPSYGRSAGTSGDEPLRSWRIQNAWTERLVLLLPGEWGMGREAPTS